MRYILYAILMASAVPLYAQEIRLDSLWIKMGGYPTMAFSPDSKTLLLGQADGIVNIVNVQSGIPLDSIILPKNGYADFGFSPDGKYLIVSERKKITFYSALTWDSVGEIRDIETVGFLSFSNDGAYVAVADWYSTISVVDLINRKQIYLIKRPDEYKGSNNQNLPYFNGKVYFSEDGTRLYGKNANDFGFWDITKKDTPFSRSFTIGNRAVIGFTPDRKYMIQQSNYIWDLNTKSQLQIEGLESKELATPGTYCHTPKGEVIFLTKLLPPTNIPQFSLVAINLAQKRILTTQNLLYPYGVVIAPDSSYLSYNYGDGQNRVYKINWNITGLVENHKNNSVKIIPNPTNNDSSLLQLYCEYDCIDADISIMTIEGTHVNQIFNGAISQGNYTYSLRTSSLPSGVYYVVMTCNKKQDIFPFIINK